MIRGTTPTLQFTLPFDTEKLKEGYITLTQSRIVTLEKALADCSCKGKIVRVRLTQEETLKLMEGKRRGVTELQLRVLTKNDEALASDIIQLDIGGILKEGVI